MEWSIRGAPSSSSIILICENSWKTLSTLLRFFFSFWSRFYFCLCKFSEVSLMFMQWRPTYSWALCLVRADHLFYNTLFTMLQLKWWSKEITCLHKSFNKLINYEHNKLSYIIILIINKKNYSLDFITQIEKIKNNNSYSMSIISKKKKILPIKRPSFTTYIKSQLKIGKRKRSANN